MENMEQNIPELPTETEYEAAAETRKQLNEFAVMIQKKLMEHPEKDAEYGAMVAEINSVLGGQKKELDQRTMEVLSRMEAELPEQAA
jgi:hypothetical protein